MTPTVEKAVRTDAGLASQLRLSVMRLRRRLANERHPDNELSLGAMAVLGSLYRHGELTVGELATLERVQPPSMTRTVTCLEDVGHVGRRRHETDGRQVVVALTDTGRDDPAGRPPPPRRLARPAGSPSSPPTNAPSSARRPRSSKGSPLVESHVPLPPQPQLPPLRRRRRRLQHRHLDAARRPGLAGPAAHRDSGAAIGITTGLQFLPFLLLSPVAGLVADRIPKRRLLQLTNIGMAVPALLLGLLAVTGLAESWHVYVLALVLGVGRRLRRPGPPVASCPSWSTATT